MIGIILTLLAVIALQLALVLKLLRGILGKMVSGEIQ